jgi:ABC-type transport system substrate-binding protein
MNRVRLSAAAALLIFFFASCGSNPSDQPVPVVKTIIPSPTPTATPIPHAFGIRFALIGNITPVNVWTLFDANGYSYNNYALMSSYWPRLYQLSIPDRAFEAMAAGGMPSPVQPEAGFYTAAVPLRSDLKWTDGKPFTADDVAFTVNTVLSFQLGFDWHDFYNPDFIDHAEAVDSHTVKFYFKKQPNVGVWQYGALQGPIVQKAYWESKIAGSAALLPPQELLSQVSSLMAQAREIQSKINELNSILMTSSPTSGDYAQTMLDVKNQQADLNQTNTALAKIQSQYDASLDAARQSLYALDGQEEPTLGDWMPAGQQNGIWVNKVNPAHPFNGPYFDNALYQTYASEDDALNAFKRKNVDEILESGGLSLSARATIGNSFPFMESPGNDLSFLVFNGSSPLLHDPAFRQALACVIDPNTTLDHLGAGVHGLTFFVAPAENPWDNSVLPCNGLDSTARLAQAVQILKAAGYKWQVSPSQNAHGLGFTLPNGGAVPAINLLVASSNDLEANSANLINQKLSLVGIQLVVQSVDPERLRYAVFSSHQYDLAILGWHVSEYPGYLCDWFGAGNPFGVHSNYLQSSCEALNSTGDLTTAQQDVFGIQSTLVHDLPFIPLYSNATYDAYRSIRYPFTEVQNGLSGIYGAPSLAIPAP